MSFVSYDITSDVVLEPEWDTEPIPVLAPPEPSTQRETWANSSIDHIHAPVVTSETVEGELPSLLNVPNTTIETEYQQGPGNYPFQPSDECVVDSNATKPTQSPARSHQRWTTSPFDTGSFLLLPKPSWPFTNPREARLLHHYINHTSPLVRTCACKC